MSDIVLFEEGLVAFLGEQEAITDIVVSNELAPRIYPERAPDKYVGPYITYVKVSGRRDSTHGGDSKLGNPRFQISCWADNKLDCITLAKAVADCLSGYQGPMAPVTRVTADVDNEIDLFDYQSRLYHRAIDVIFWNTEA